MRFLIAGLGSIGRRHLRNLRALGQEEIILYRTHQATLPDAELGNFPTFTELSLALAEKPDGVIVANPTALHLEVAIAAAKAGAALLIEKPVSDSLAGLGDLQAALAQFARAYADPEPGLRRHRIWRPAESLQIGTKKQSRGLLF